MKNDDALTSNRVVTLRSAEMANHSKIVDKNIKINSSNNLHKLSSLPLSVE